MTSKILEKFMATGISESLAIRLAWNEMGKEERGSLSFEQLEAALGEPLLANDYAIRSAQIAKAETRERLYRIFDRALPGGDRWVKVWGILKERCETLKEREELWERTARIDIPEEWSKDDSSYKKLLNKLIEKKTESWDFLMEKFEEKLGVRFGRKG